MLVVSCLLPTVKFSFGDYGVFVQSEFLHERRRIYTPVHLNTYSCMHTHVHPHTHTRVYSCFSAPAAHAFVEAGVPHVIAIQESVKVTDNSARSYAKHVYMSLCQGMTVRQACGKGRAGVIAKASSITPPCCCAHLHAPTCVVCVHCRLPTCCETHANASACHVSTQCCKPELPHDESLKFLLLGRIYGPAYVGVSVGVGVGVCGCNYVYVGMYV